MVIKIDGGKPPHKNTQSQLIMLLSTFEDLYRYADKKSFNNELRKFRDEYDKLAKDRHYVSKATYGVDFTRFLAILRAIYALGYTHFKYFDINILNEHLKCSIGTFLIMLDCTTYFNITKSIIKGNIVKPTWYRNENYQRIREKIDKLMNSDEFNDERVRECTGVRELGLFNDLKTNEEEFYKQSCGESKGACTNIDDESDPMDICEMDDRIDSNNPNAMNIDQCRNKISDNKQELDKILLWLEAERKNPRNNGIEASLVPTALHGNNNSNKQNGETWIHERDDWISKSKSNIGHAGGSKKKGGKRKLKSYKFN
jgi:hypothetical protein